MIVYLIFKYLTKDKVPYIPSKRNLEYMVHNCCRTSKPSGGLVIHDDLKSLCHVIKCLVYNGKYRRLKFLSTLTIDK